jgi:hypothetical protein
MKNILFKLSLAAALLLFSAPGCKKEFLDREPLGQLTFDTFFETAEHARQATNAVYSQLRDWDCVSLPYIGATDIISDDADKGSTPNDALYLLEVDNFTFDATNGTFSSIWTGYFKVIARANLAIQRIPDVDMDATLKARLIGENKFLRAYAYFLLVQWFGDLPIILEPLATDAFYEQDRKPKADVYAQIERDLQDAIASLPKKSGYAPEDLGRATQGAAQGMLAKLYMVKHEYDKAEAQLRAIIESGDYSLMANYNDVFLPVGENGSESIFEINAAALPPDQSGVIGPGATAYNMVQGVRGIPNLGWGFNRPSDDLLTAYEHNSDPRREGTILYVGEYLPDQSDQVRDNPEILGERYNQKAWVPAHSGLQDNGPGNIRILRYADVLLLMAEALNEQGKGGEALPYLNEVRARAKASGLVPPSVLAPVTTTDQTLLRERIRRERRVELAMEQHRWFDLLRWGIVAERMLAVGKPFVANKHELLPIPQTEVDLTVGRIYQNPGY